VGDSLRHAGFFGEVPASMVDRDPNLTKVEGDCLGPASAHNLNQFVFAAKADDPAFEKCLDADEVYNPDGFVNDVLVVKHVLPRPLLDSPRPAPPAKHDPTKDDGEIGFNGLNTLQTDKTYVMTNNVSGLMFDGYDTPPDISVGGAMPNSSAWEYQYEVFYVSKDPDADEDAPPQLSRRVLVWKDDHMELQSEELTEGVENLRLLFGFDDDDDGDVDRYTNSAGVTDWSQVDSVEVYMLIRSATTDEQYVDLKTYQLGDEAVTPPADERNFRRLLVFTSVSMRNLQLIIRGGA
jgi:type IV pilus assembly protein PilW